MMGEHSSHDANPFSVAKQAFHTAVKRRAADTVEMPMVLVEQEVQHLADVVREHGNNTDNLRKMIGRVRVKNGQRPTATMTTAQVHCTA